MSAGTCGQIRLAMLAIVRAIISLAGCRREHLGFDIGDCGGACRSDVYVHASCCVGWRWTNLVRRGTACAPRGHCRAGNGRHVPDQSALSRCRCGSSPRRLGAAGGNTNGDKPRWACIGSRPCDAMPISRRCWRKSNGGVVCLTNSR